MTLTSKGKGLRRLASRRFQRLGGEFLWIGLGQAVAVLGSMIGVRILTELLAPEAYGQLALGMTVSTLVQLVVLGPLGNGATRFYAPAQEAGALRAYLSVVYRMVLISTGGIILAALLSAVGLVLVGLSQWVGLGLAALCFALLSGYNSILNGIQNAARQRTVVALHQALSSGGRFLAAAGLIFWLGATSTAAMLGYSLAMVIVLGSQYIFFRRIIVVNPTSNGIAPQTMVDVGWQRQMFDYAWPFATWGIMGWLLLSSDRWALQIFASTQDVGFYAVLFQLGFYPLSILASLAGTLLAPIYFNRVGDASDPIRVLAVFSIGWKITLISISGTIVLSIVAFFTHQSVFSLLVAKEYLYISGLLPGMLLASGLVVSAQFCTIVLHTQRTTKLLIAPKNISSMMGIVIIYAGAAWYGVVGVVFAKIVYSLVHLIWIILIFHGQYKQLRLRIATNGMHA